MTPAVEARNLRVPFGNDPGLEEISFTVDAGERFVIVGGSGVGKTTLLRGVAGLAPLSGGALEVGGRDVTRLPARERGIVYLHQTPLLFPHLDVYENIAFPMRVRGAGEREISARVKQLLEHVRLEAYARRMPKTLSGGQKHRVALSRAIAARPEVLLLDEPLSALDPALRTEVRGALISLQREYGPALVMVTHDLDEAGVIADRIAVMIEGRLAQIGTPQKVFSAPATAQVARFIGIANEVAGHLAPDGIFESILGRLACARLEGRVGSATGFVRPDGLKVDPKGLIPGTIEAIRYRSHSITLLVRVGDQLLEVNAGPESGPVVGRSITLSVEPSRVQVFLDEVDHT